MCKEGVFAQKDFYIRIYKSEAHEEMPKEHHSDASNPFFCKDASENNSASELANTFPSFPSPPLLLTRHRGHREERTL